MFWRKLFSFIKSVDNLSSCKPPLRKITSSKLISVGVSPTKTMRISSDSPSKSWANKKYTSTKKLDPLPMSSLPKRSNHLTGRILGKINKMQRYLESMRSDVLKRECSCQASRLSGQGGDKKGGLEGLNKEEGSSFDEDLGEGISPSTNASTLKGDQLRDFQMAWIAARILKKNNVLQRVWTEDGVVYVKMHFSNIAFPVKSVQELRILFENHDHLAAESERGKPCKSKIHTLCTFSFMSLLLFWALLPLPPSHPHNTMAGTMLPQLIKWNTMTTPATSLTTPSMTPTPATSRASTRPGMGTSSGDSTLSTKPMAPSGKSTTPPISTTVSTPKSRRSAPPTTPPLHTANINLISGHPVNTSKVIL